MKFPGELKLRIISMDKTYDNGDGVKDINLDVYNGELVTMVGPSGCGKTTILRTIGGFLSVDKGDITINGSSIIALTPEKRPTAMVFQSYNLWPHMSVYENLAFGLKLRKYPKAEITRRIDAMLEMVKMPGFQRKYPNQLSGGQQQRIAIARSLLLQPEVLLLDEPFSALDAKIRMQMREELKKIQKELGITVIFVTHDQEEAMAISHRIVVMNKGVFEQIGTPTEIYDNPATKYVASFIGEMNFWEHEKGISAVRPENVKIFPGFKERAINGHIRTIMILGHYADVNIQCGERLIKSFIPRTELEGFTEGGEVHVEFRTQTEFPRDTALPQS
jgi:putative spermidine/putrescine transport system ATP-binding protein